MWTLFILLTICGLNFSASASPPSPVNVSFSSVNLRNVLHWIPGIDTPDDTLFTVEYAIYGDSVEGNKGRRVNWRAVQKCQQIVRTWCDLSSETEDEEQGYHARVRAVTTGASSKWALTRRRFDPKVDTSFGPPMVSVEIENNSAVITLKGPMRYPSKKHSTEISLATVYPQMTYSLLINNTYRKQVLDVPVAVSPHKHRLLDYNTQYCFSARSRFLSMPIQCQASAWHCIITPQDPLIEQLRTVVVSIVVPGVCLGIFVVLGYVLHQYLSGKGQKSPLILNSPYFHPAPVTFLSENPSHNVVMVGKEPLSVPVGVASAPECAGGQRGIVQLPPPYSPQNLEELPEVWDEASVEYGFVSAAPRIIDDEGRERRLDEGNVGCSPPLNSLEVVGDHSSDVPAPLQISCQTHNLLHSYRKTHRPGDGQTDGHEAARPQIKSTLEFQKSAGEASREETEDKEEAVSLEHMDEDEGHESENKPLLSVYASQNIQNMSSSTLTHSDYLPDDYAFLAGAMKKTKGDHYGNGGDDKGKKSCVGFNPEARRLVAPELSKEETDVLMVPEGERGGFMGEDEEGSYLRKGELRLTDVFVRQASGEDLASQRKFEQDEVWDWEVDEHFSKWDLQICMGE